jgi:hypothetical protein
MEPGKITMEMASSALRRDATQEMKGYSKLDESINKLHLKMRGEQDELLRMGADITR